ncbi:MAG TPA: helix-turn-helix transcriptional regulator [Flavobacteriaceae bacterium]|nr:helix-turn-helix transcriptional regulator [Flavobacteriaceae bacterium]
MCQISISKALAIEDDTLKLKIDLAQKELEGIPDTFYALFWLYTHDFLYISPNISKVTGHPFEVFQKHGMVFFQSIIPPHLIEHIYKSMNAQAAQIEQHPDYLLAEEFLTVKAAVYNLKNEEIPVKYNAVLLDTKIFDPPSYLVLCSWIATHQLSKNQVEENENRIKSGLLELKRNYLESIPERLAFLMSGKKLSEREKEVADLLSKGLSSKNIGEQLNISFNTVESHRKNLLQKLKAKNTAELVYKLSQV